MSGKERKIVKVDENKLKRMIAGEEEDNQDVNTETVPPDKEDNQQKEVQPEKTETVTRKKKQKTDYTGTFLRLNKPLEKRPTTIQLSAENYIRIENLMILSPGMSMAMFINNILDNHFEENSQDIDEVIAARIKKITNKQ